MNEGIKQIIERIPKGILLNLQVLTNSLQSNAYLSDFLEIFIIIFAQTTFELKEWQLRSDIEEDWYNAYLLIKRMAEDDYWFTQEEIEKTIKDADSVAKMSVFQELMDFQIKLNQWDKILNKDMDIEEFKIFHDEYWNNIDIKDLSKEILKALEDIEGVIRFIYVDYIEDKALIQIDEDIVNKEVPVEKRLTMSRDRIKLVEDFDKKLFSDKISERGRVFIKIINLWILAEPLKDKKTKVIYKELYETVYELYFIYFALTKSARKRLNFDKYISLHQIEDNWDLDKKYKDLKEFSLLTESWATLESTKNKREALTSRLEWLKIDISQISNKKKCPFCKEEIQELAKKCRFCWEWLEETALLAKEQLNKEISPKNPREFKVYFWSFSWTNAQGFISDWSVIINNQELILEWKKSIWGVYKFFWVLLLMALPIAFWFILWIIPAILIGNFIFVKKWSFVVKNIYKLSCKKKVMNVYFHKEWDKTGITSFRIKNKEDEERITKLLEKLIQ